MSTPDPIFDVRLVPRSALPALATDPDPGKVLRARTPWPFLPDTPVNGDTAHYTGVAVTVVNMLAEPVVAIGVANPYHGAPAGKPRVTVGGATVAPPGLPSGNDDLGWVDPAPSPDLVSVGSWVATDHVPRYSGFAVQSTSFLLHLRCVTSGVDFLVGALCSPRYLTDVDWASGWNPYQIEMFEPGKSPDPDDYDTFYNDYVNYQGTSDDLSGTSAAGTVSYLARSPQGRTDNRWQVYLILAPDPVATAWTAPAPAPSAAELAALRAARIEDWANRMIVVDSDCATIAEGNKAVENLFDTMPLRDATDIGVEAMKIFLSRRPVRS